MIFPRASLKRSPRTRTRKNSVPADMDIVCPPPRSSTLARRKTPPPPLQIIPELSESELDYSPETARPTQRTPQQPEPVSSRVTLSEYTFSIDDALLMLGDDAPRSPALSASSTSDGTSSDDVPATPGTSDDEDGYSFMLPLPRHHPRRISIRPLCIIKTRSLICHDDEDFPNCLEKEEETLVSIPVSEEVTESLVGVEAATGAAQETEQDFYSREFEDFISLLPSTPSPTAPARRDSLILDDQALPVVIEVPKPKPRGRSRHSKPLPLLPPVTPPISSFPLIPRAPLVQVTAQKSIVRRRLNVPPLPKYPPPSFPIVSRPLPRMSIPLDIEDCVFLEEDLDVLSRRSVVVEQSFDMGDDTSICSRPSFIYMGSAGVCPLPPAIPETPLAGMYGEVTLPRSSTDSDAPRSSTDSTSFPNTPTTPFTFPSSPSSEERLRSRWSSSTLGSLAVESRPTLFSPLRNVFGSRMHWTPPQKMALHLTPSKSPKNKHGSPSPPSKRIHRQGSQSSTSSIGTSSSERDSRDGSPNGLKRKPIPLAMFSRAT